MNNTISQNNYMQNYNFTDDWQTNLNKENLGIHQSPNDLSQNYYEITQAKNISQNINNKE